jgi:hypothetical protein
LSEVLRQLRNDPPQTSPIPIFLDLPWSNRPETEKELYSITLRNIQHYFMGKVTKQDYVIPVVHGGIGIEKS